MNTSKLLKEYLQEYYLMITGGDHLSNDFTVSNIHDWDENDLKKLKQKHTHLNNIIRSLENSKTAFSKSPLMRMSKSKLVEMITELQKKNNNLEVENIFIKNQQEEMMNTSEEVMKALQFRKTKIALLEKEVCDKNREICNLKRQMDKQHEEIQEIKNKLKQIINSSQETHQT